ncbi:SDR family oxidoreductase [Conexibacter sp. DBS9H8]|uniref:SDR family oxidoreductase n=1 Tax=Conexibacter sp. DBS9H8 TaxID=2937801 RepID=UPI00200E1F85|nr:SDR family oxidoreductase [Conexibacter sp. DBS9H8]
MAVVTGAARGIGAAIARRLAEDGYDVAALDLDEGACEETAAAVTGCGRRSVAVGADVGDEVAVTRAVERIAAELGPPVALVNNAGIQRDRILSRMTVTEWESVMAVHLRGAFLMCRETQRHMREAMWGRIVNISSTAALGNVGQVNYSAAKAGLQGLTRTLAMELGRHNITVNAVAPGFTITDMTRGTAARVGIDFDEMVASQVSQIAVGRAGEPQDIAQAVSFFLDPRSGFVSGQVLYVAGGPRG